MSLFKNIFVLSLICSCYAASLLNNVNNSRREALSYTAAVVELHPSSFYKGLETVSAVTAQIVDILKSKDTRNADIVVFPESLINGPDTAILLPESTAFCDDENAHYVLQNISCAVRNAQKYVVIDLNIKVKCSMDDQPFCANQLDSTNLYNMAMVFDRNGVLIAKYRKYNLFNEAVVQKTMKPDLVIFKIDFNVTFGVFICFDLTFSEPASTLIDQGVKHFVYPTMWPSEIPYLTAAQVQQGWAYTNDVTLLAANANLPYIKSSGSGIYAGRRGALKVFISESAQTRILIADVPIDNRLPLPTKRFDQNAIGNAETDRRIDEAWNTNPFAGTNPLNLVDLFQEDLSEFSIQFLDFTKSTRQAGNVCKNGVCCVYDIEVQDNGDSFGKASYSYAISVFNGHRSYKSMPNLSTAQTICSVIACTEMNSQNACGKRILGKETYNRFNFEKLILQTELAANSSKIMPNTLTTDLLPLTAKEFKYKVSKSQESDKYAVRLELKSPKSDLLTFAIYSRDYSRDIISSA